MKKHFSVLFSSMAVTVAVMTSSCGGIWDFALPAETVELALNEEPMTGGSLSETEPPLLIQEYHRETFRDPPFSPTSGGEATNGSALNGSASEVDTSGFMGYIPLSPLLRLTRAEAETLLSEAGIPYEIFVVPTPAPAGTVSAVEYAGFYRDGSLGGRHYVNPAEPVRLYISAEKPILPAPTVENTVYITFDDGPTENGTEEILDILDTYGIPATFFLVGNSAEKAPEEVLAIAERGHVLGCHSMSHDYGWLYADPANLIGEVEQWTALMEEIGVDFTAMPKLFRYPGGSRSVYFSEETLAIMNEALSALGFSIYDWNIVANDALLTQCPYGMTSYDYIKTTFLETYAEAKKREGEPLILLLHETVAETRVVLPWMIEYLIADGCTFGTLQ